MMRVLQINAVYKKMSTGRTTSEMHEYMREHGIESFVASPDLSGLTENSFKISSKYDMKLHAFMSRLTGLQGYHSCFATHKLLRYIDSVKPDVIHLRNLHGNYINLKILLKYIAKNNIATVITLHDCWFYTGKCCHYLEDNCKKWKTTCGKCPALKKHNNSWFFDRSKKMQKDKKELFSKIRKLGVVGVSSWVTNDAEQSAILKNATISKTIYNWIDLTLFNSQNYENLSTEFQDKFVILGVAQNWTSAKGVDVFLKLSEIIDDDCVIVMIGNPNGHKSTQKIKFVGTTDSAEELAKYYALADVFLNPSIQETFGKTTAEAMASGTPVVALNSTAAPEILGTDGKCGYVLDKNSAMAYLEMVRLIKEQGKDKYSESCRKRAEEMFDKNTNIKAYINLYESLVKPNEGE